MLGILTLLIAILLSLSTLLHPSSQKVDSLDDDSTTQPDSIHSRISLLIDTLQSQHDHILNIASSRNISRIDESRILVLIGIHMILINTLSRIADMTITKDELEYSDDLKLNEIVRIEPGLTRVYQASVSQSHERCATSRKYGMDIHTRIQEGMLSSQFVDSCNDRSHGPNRSLSGPA